jgi:hypothetical protein
MSDHTDFIAIHGLQSSASEVFQGISASFTATGGTTGGGTVSSTGAFDPSSLINELSDSFGDLWGWISQQQGEGEERSLSRGSRMVPALIMGGLPAVIGALAPVVAATATVSATHSVVDGFIRSIIDLINPASEQWRLYGIENRLEEIRDILKTGLIWEDGLLQIDKSILGTGLLKEVDGKMESRLGDVNMDEVVEALESLKYNDEEIDFGPFRVKLRSKILDYN